MIHMRTGYLILQDTCTLSMLKRISPCSEDPTESEVPDLLIWDEDSGESMVRSTISSSSAWTLRYGAFAFDCVYGGGGGGDDGWFSEIASS